MYALACGTALETLPLTCIQPLEIKNTKFTTEVRAGLTTFFTMAYIIAVNVRLSPARRLSWH